MEFSWWAKSEEGKCQIRARYHGHAVRWERKEGRFVSWEPHSPGDTDWDQLLADAGRRVPRRLLSPRQFDELKRLASQARG